MRKAKENHHILLLFARVILHFILLIFCFIYVSFDINKSYNILAAIRCDSFARSQRPCHTHETMRAGFIVQLSDNLVAFFIWFRFVAGWICWWTALADKIQKHLYLLWWGNAKRFCKLFGYVLYLLSLSTIERWFELENTQGQILAKVYIQLN